MSPLFDTLENLLAALRLSGVCATSDATAQVQKCVEAARLWLYNALGQSKLNTLQATVVPPTGPTTDEEYRALQAKLIECRMVYYHVCRTLAMMTMDGSAGMNEIYETEAAFRLMSYEERVESCRVLKKDIEGDLDMLGVQDKYRQSEDFKVLVIGAPCPPPSSRLVGGGFSDPCPGYERPWSLN